MENQKSNQYISFLKSILKHPTSILFLFMLGLVTISKSIQLPEKLAVEPTEELQETSRFFVNPPLPNLIPEATSSPQLSAQAVYVIDQASDAVMLAKNEEQQLLPASTTKIMTALIALENYDIDEVVRPLPGQEVIGNTADIPSGFQFTVRDLLYASLVSSANDAALILAQHHPKGYSYFVQLMNQRAMSLGMQNTHYNNVSGLESQYHYTSAKDLSLLTKEAVKKQLFSEMVASESYTIQDLSQNFSQTLYTTNQLLGQVEGVKGVKTGWTEEAGECLVTLVEKDGKEVIIVVLGSEDRFGETRLLIDWIYQNHIWI